MKVMVDMFEMELDQAIDYCLQQRNIRLILARQYRHDMAWFKAHDPAEYEMQLLQNSVSVEIAYSREYHHIALDLRRLKRMTPVQGVLL